MASAILPDLSPVADPPVAEPAAEPDLAGGTGGRARPGRASLDAVFAALSDPTRRAILSMLLEDDMAVTDVAAGFPVSLAAVSRHLQVLAEAGLVSQEKRGRITWCRLEPDALRDASAWMAGFGMLEGVDLDAFERFLGGELGDPLAQSE